MPYRCNFTSFSSPLNRFLLGTGGSLRPVVEMAGRSNSVGREQRNGCAGPGGRAVCRFIAEKSPERIVRRRSRAGGWTSAPYGPERRSTKAQTRARRSKFELRTGSPAKQTATIGKKSISSFILFILFYCFFFQIVTDPPTETET